MMLLQNFLTSDLINRLWDDELIEKEVSKLDPVCCFIDTVQSRDCTLAVATHKWLQLEPIPRHHCNWLKQCDMICVLLAFIAYCLYPTMKGQLLNQHQKKKVELAIYNHGRSEQTFEAFKKFQQGQGLFGDTDALELSGLLGTYGRRIVKPARINLHFTSCINSFVRKNFFDVGTCTR